MTPRERIDNARKTNDRRDRLDRKVGFADPGLCPEDLMLRTIMSAIWAGLESDDWDCVAEGYEMAVDLHLRMTGKRFDIGRHA